MSTKKTPYLKLHAWESQDDFLREEFNANFAKLDDCLSKTAYVFGTYNGNYYTPRNIDLGFRPTAVLIIDKDGNTSTSSSVNGGLIGPGFPLYRGSTEHAHISDTGFILSQIDINREGITYYYLAFR